MKGFLFPIIAAVITIAVCSLTYADNRVNIDSHRHPNLYNAQMHISQAYDDITAAQNANDYDLDGHAKNAKALLDQAMRELKLCARWANDRKRDRDNRNRDYDKERDRKRQQSDTIETH